MNKVIKYIVYFLPALYWLWSAGAWISYPFDIDPSDGDVVNAALRIKAGFPLYGDWSKAEIFGNYGPIYYLFIAGLSFIVSLPKLIITLRVFNAIFIITTFFFSLLSLQAILKSSKQFIPSLLFSLLFWVVMGENTIGALTLQTNALFFAVQAIALYLALASPQRWVIGLLVVAALPMVKQSGVATSAVLLGFLIKNNKGIRIKILLSTLALAGALMLGLEYWNDWNYLQASFFTPREVFSDPASWFEDYPKTLLFQFFRGEYWLYYFCNFALVLSSFFIKSLRPVVVFVFAELALFFKIGHNIGGSICYLWFYGLLLCVFVAKLWQTLSTSLLSKLAVYKVYNLFAFLLLVWTCYYSIVLMNSKRKQRNEQLSYALAVQQDAMSNGLKDFLNKNNKASWFSPRHSMPLVLSGILLDVEACTLQFALEKKGVVDLDLLEKRFKEGKYKFIWKTNLSWMPQVKEWVRQCYIPVKEVPWAYRSKNIDAAIYQYNGCI